MSPFELFGHAPVPLFAHAQAAGLIVEQLDDEAGEVALVARAGVKRGLAHRPSSLDQVDWTIGRASDMYSRTLFMTQASLYAFLGSGLTQTSLAQSRAIISVSGIRQVKRT